MSKQNFYFKQKVTMDISSSLNTKNVPDWGCVGDVGVGGGTVVDGWGLCSEITLEKKYKS